MLRVDVRNFLDESQMAWASPDNGSNMVKAGRLMTELTRLPCTAHTLQLVIGKGLLPAEVLI